MTFTISPPYKLRVLAQPSGVPAWFTAAGVNQWTDMLKPHPSAATMVFSGGVINTVGLYIGNTFRNGTWFCTFGGGHVSTTDNSLWAFGPWESEIPDWYRISSRVEVPTTIDPTTGSGYESFNGYPPSPHSYDTLQFFPGRNWMVTGIAAIFNHSGAPVSGTATWIFDFNVPNPLVNNPWTRVGNNVQHATESVTCYDSVVDLVYQLRASQNMGYFTPGTSPGAGVWSQYIQGTGFDSSGSKAAWHPSRLMVVGPGAFNIGRRADLKVINLVTGASQFLTPSGTQPPIITDNDHASIEWVPSQNKFALVTDSVGSGQVGQRSVWWLATGADPTTLTGWSYTVETPAGGATPDFQDRQGQGIHSRFRQIDNGLGLKGLALIAYNQGIAKLYFRRLP